MNSRVRHAALLGCTAAAAGALLLAAGGPSVPTPAPHLDAWRALVEEHGAVVAVFAVLRLALLVVCAFVATLGVLHAATAAVGCRPLERAALLLTPRVLRPFLGLVSVASLSAPTLATTTWASAATGGAETSPPPIMVVVGAPTTSTTTTASGGPPPTMHRVDTAGATPSMVVVPSSATVAPTTTTVPSFDDVAVVSPVAPKARPATTAPATIDAPATWTIRRGEHLWSVAEHSLTTRLGRPPAVAEVRAYWRALIDANRDRLVDRDDPDLVYAGQEFVLPPTS